MLTAIPEAMAVAKDVPKSSFVPLINENVVSPKVLMLTSCSTGWGFLFQILPVVKESGKRSTCDIHSPSSILQSDDLD